MKKIISLLCIFSILALCGCASKNIVSEKNGVDEAIIVEEPEIEISNNEEISDNTLENEIKLIDNTLTFNLNWNKNELVDVDYDLDLIAFMLNAEDINYDTNGFVFYNNRISFDNSIVLSEDIRKSDTDSSEFLAINLDLVDEETVRIPILVCRFYDDTYDLSELDSVNLIVKNGDTVIKSYSIISEGVSFEVCDLLRTDEGWYLVNKEINSKEDLYYFAKNYGLDV